MKTQIAELIAGRRKPQPSTWRRCQRTNCHMLITHECQHRRYCSEECEEEDEREIRLTAQTSTNKEPWR